MKPSHHRVKPEITIAVLAYELNSVALTVAAEAESLVRSDQVADCECYLGCVEMAGQMHALISQLRQAAAVLRFVRHTGQMPPRQINVN